MNDSTQHQNTRVQLERLHDEIEAALRRAPASDVVDALSAWVVALTQHKGTRVVPLGEGYRVEVRQQH